MNGPPENVGAKLTPVAAAGCATRQAKATTDRCTQHVEIVETKPFDESHSLEQRRVEINFVGRLPENKSFSIRRGEGETLTSRHKGIRNDVRRLSFRCLSA